MRIKPGNPLFSVAVILVMIFGLALNSFAVQIGSSIIADATDGTNLYAGESFNNTSQEIYSASSNCAATVSPSLVVHIPILTYNIYKYWLDLTYNAAASAFAITNGGLISDMTPYASCAASTLSSDFNLHIPVLMLGNDSYWIDLKYDIEKSGFVITAAGQNSPPTCTYYITPTSQFFSSSGGSGSVTVTTSASSCAWTVSESLTWVSITSGSSGTGNGTVSYSVSTTTSTSSRTGTMTIAGQTFTITQAAQSCTYTISPTNETFTSSGGAGSVTVTASNSSCTWTASENLDWVSITSGSSGTGNETVSYSVSTNTSTSSRTGTMTIAGQTFTITQSGITGPSAWALQVFKNSKNANGQNTDGDGMITSAPVGIICGDTCGAYFFAGDQIVLTAVPNAGSTFTGWSGACSGTGSCVVTMDTDQSVTANFTKPLGGEGGPSFPQSTGVKVVIQGTVGSGSVTSNPAGIYCGKSFGTYEKCSAQFALGFPVILTATSAASYVFSGWKFNGYYVPTKPDCPGTAPCTVLAHSLAVGAWMDALFSRGTAPPPTPPPYCNVGCSSDCFAPVSYQSNSCAECAAVYNGCVAAQCANQKYLLYWNACR